MSWGVALEGVQWFILLYFIVLNLGYLALNAVSIVELRKHLDARLLDVLPRAYSAYEAPVSIVVPAYNEEAIIVTSVRSLLQLDYPELEVIVVNDGSRDATLDVLRREFDLTPFPEAYWRRVPAKPLHGIYRSRRVPNLRVVDKENGGSKADAVNAGLNAARYPLFCVIDADSVLERSSLRRIVAPFLHEPDVIAAGGTVRIANGCEVRDGFLETVRLPARILPLFQTLEYIRAFLFSRLAWAPSNAVPIVSGAFGMFRTSAVVEAGGMRQEAIGEDMELVVRLHRLNRLGRRPYRVAFLPDPACWTEAPESLGVLRGQRTRWQRGLGQSLALNHTLICHPRGGAPGWLSLPFMVVFELLSPLVEIAGYVFMALGLAYGVVSTATFFTFMFLAFAMGLLLSTSALYLEEMAFHLFRRPGDLAKLAAIAVLENLGYRQLVTLWRLHGLWQWAVGARVPWGEMKRIASWQRKS
ncbi:MAG TPA: glycosyltransferase [Burkholderiales bacterium]|nr:glycosyltransferase [Burkholderiales bacterium]